MSAMYSNFPPPGNATSPKPASHLGISDHHGGDETKQFFDFDAWDPPVIGSGLTVLPCDTTFDFGGYVTQPFEHTTAANHDTQESGRGFGLEDGNFADSHLPNLFSVDTAFSDLGLGPDWQCPTTFDASMTLDDLNAFDEAVASGHPLAAERINLPGDNIPCENNIRFENGITPGDDIASDHAVLNIVTGPDSFRIPYDQRHHRSNSFLRGPHLALYQPTQPVLQSHEININGEVSFRPPTPLKSSKSRRTRIGTSAKELLRDSFKSNPYPNDDDTSFLARATQLTRRTVKTWFSNARARKRIFEPWNTQDSLDNDDATPSCRAGLSRTISRNSLEALDKLSPTASLASLQRYLETPASEESVAMDVVATIVNTTADHIGPQTMMTKMERASRRASSIRARSVTKSDTSGSSATSFRSTDSRGSRRGRKLWRRAQQSTLPGVEDDADESRESCFCTWPGCPLKFKFRWEWARHEEAIHYQPYQWICCLRGTETKPLAACFVCNQHNTTIGHVMEHHFLSCMNKSQNYRTFLREDQLVQHLRVHVISHLTKKDCQELLSIWKITNPAEVNTTYTCGFCGNVFFDWTERQNHVFQHIRRGIFKSYWWPERLPMAIAAAKPGMLPLPESHSQTCHNCGIIFDNPGAIRDHSVCTVWSCRYLNDYLAIFDVDTASEVGKYSFKCCLCDFESAWDHSQNEMEELMSEHADTHDLWSCQQPRFSSRAAFAGHLRQEHGAIFASSSRMMQSYACRQELSNGVAILSQCAPNTNNRGIDVSPVHGQYRLTL